MRRRAVILVGVLLALCCGAAVLGGLAYFFFVPTAEAKPLVLINSPRYGERIGVGELVTIHAIARDEAKVTRVELWVDGELQEAKATNLAEGISPFPLLAQWRPLSPGAHTLTVRAFNAHDGRAHGSVHVEAIAEPDQDGDGVVDRADVCPDEQGWSASAGCPDRDGDGIPDAGDACPDEAGLPDGGGCPTPSERDGDGDGLLDETDACPGEAGAPAAEGCPDGDGDSVADAGDRCPDEPGLPEHDGCPVEGDLDGDGVSDAADGCPEEWGLPEHGGCADDDGDGVRDRDDACLDEPGLPERAGCPDRDGDGVADGDDLRPDEPGLPEHHGAPDTGAPDSDGDGVPDDIDECDDERGRAEHFGCPPPGEAEDTDGDGIADDAELPGGAEALFGVVVPLLWELQERFAFGEGDDPIPIARVDLQFEFLALEVSGDYDEVWCYTYEVGPPHPEEAETAIRLYGPFERLEDRSWNIRELLGGRESLYFVWDDTWRMPVFIECEGYVGAAPPINLGRIRDSPGYEGHDASEWGVEITRRSSGGDGGAWFEVTYRLCYPRCPAGDGPVELLPLPPYVRVYDRWVIWSWEGDPNSIGGFNLYGGDTLIAQEEPGNFGLIGPFTPPPCDGTYEFHMTAFDGPYESPLSNTGVARGPACSRTVQITFERLITHDLPGDEGDHRVGPIEGAFWTAPYSSWLEFNACCRPSDCWGSCKGLRLNPNSDYDIQEDIFEWIWRRKLGCMGGGWGGSPCEGDNYHAPEGNTVTVELGPDDDLTITGVIVDCECDGGSQWLLYEQHTIQSRAVRSGSFMFRDEDCVIIGHKEVVRN